MHLPFALVIYFQESSPKSPKRTIKIYMHRTNHYSTLCNHRRLKTTQIAISRVSESINEEL